jgi:hypothetical protein
MSKEKRDSKSLIEQLAKSDQALQSFTINMPGAIDLARPEDAELLELLSYHVAAGSLYEAQPGVFKYTPAGIENLKEVARSSRQARLEVERMCRN